MMRYAFVVALLAALLAACAGSEPASQTPDALSTAVVQSREPQPVGEVPEGVLLVQRESRLPATFGIAADGSVAERGKGFAYLPAPDGEHAAFLRGESQDRPSEVVIINGEGRETFTAQGPEPSPDSIYLALLWSADGSRLAYTLPDEAHLSQNRVYTVNADGSGDRRVTQEAGAYVVVGWTADGRLLVHDGANLVLMGGKNETLSLPDGLQTTGGFQMAPDGRWVAFTAGESAEAQELWVMDTDSGESRLVAKMGRQARRPLAGLYVSAGVPPGAKAVDAAAAMMKGPPPVAWSPDGRRIAYYRSWTDKDSVFRSELRVVNAETGEDMGVTEEGGWSAIWSPDGRYLAEPESDNRSVVLLGPGDEVRTLDVRANRVLWSPAGSLIAISAGGVRLVDPEMGTVTEALTAASESVTGAWGWEPVCSPDGRYLALVTTEDPGRSNGSLYVVDTQTAEVTLVLEKGSFHPVAWLRG